MKKLLNIGINEDLTTYQHDLVKVSNISALILFFLSVVFGAFFILESRGDLIFAFFPFAIAAAVFILNALKLNQIARFVFLVGGSFFFTSLHAYLLLPGEQAMGHFIVIQLGFFVLIWLMVDVREKWLLAATLLFTVISFFSFSLLNSMLDAFSDYSSMSATEVTWAVLILCIVVYIISAFHIQKKSIDAEKSFSAVNDVLNDKLKELKQQEDELQKTLDDISRTHREDDKRSWVSTGIAEINDILRSQDETLYDRLIRGIIKYAGLMYGGIYEMEESDHGDKFFVLKASYGFDRAKIERRKYSVTEGILGRVFFEKAPVYSVEVTKEYGVIQSGLGEAIPGSAFVLPLIHDEKIKGVLEVAAFQRIEGKENDYLERVAKVVARFMESYQVSVQSKDLLETTQQQNEEMRSQEEEMRQNMEELQATQEELHRKEQEYIARIKELESRLEKAKRSKV